MTTGGAAWWQGVVCCRARVCPTCFIARRFKLANEIEYTVHERERETRRVAHAEKREPPQSMLCTLTVRHHMGDPVDLAKQVRSAWRSLLQTRWWRSFRDRHGIEFVVAEEVTRGDNGWHPHLHALLMPRTAIDLEEGPLWKQESGYSPAESDIYELWCEVVEKKLGEAHVPNREHGIDLSPCDSAAYLTKLGLELADPAAVKGASPLALLQDGRIDEYMTLQQSRTRARDVTWSRGLKDIRESMPKSSGEPALLAELRGSEWGQLVHAGWKVPLEVAEEATDPEAAAAAIARALKKKQVFPPR